MALLPFLVEGALSLNLLRALRLGASYVALQVLAQVPVSFGVFL